MALTTSVNARQLKRHWSDVTTKGGTILLDAKAVLTPARAPLLLPNAALAEAVAGEWRVVGERIDPRMMKLTGLSNAAIDRVAPDPAKFAASLATSAASDLLCYRAATPPPLVARQSEVWDPLLAWARTRYDVSFTVTAGVVPVPQPDATIDRLARALAKFDAFALAAMSPLITIGGSLVAALAIAEQEIDPKAAFDATHLDEIWQVELWGEDALALEARQARAADFVAAAGMLELLHSTPSP